MLRFDSFVCTTSVASWGRLNPGGQDSISSAAATARFARVAAPGLRDRLPPFVLLLSTSKESLHLLSVSLFIAEGFFGLLMSFGFGR